MRKFKDIINFVFIVAGVAFSVWFWECMKTHRLSILDTTNQVVSRGLPIAVVIFDIALGFLFIWDIIDFFGED